MGAIVIILIALMVWGVKTSNSGSAFEIDKVSPRDHVKGNASSTIAVIEYSDFQCPACRNYYLAMKELSTEFGGRVAFVFRNFPLRVIHQNAGIAAQAAQAASKQGKFWEMHDLLFEKQAEWSAASDPAALFKSYAKLLGLSVDQFETDLNSSETKNFVRSQEANAISLGLQGTPTFFVNGKQIQNPSSVEEFRALIRDAIAGKI